MLAHPCYSHALPSYLGPCSVYGVRHMANEEQFEILKQGVDAWNKWRKDHLDIKADLSDINLSGANLSNVFFYGVDLAGTDFSRANLSNACFTEAFLLNANFTQADLTHTFSPEAFASADFIEANLSKAHFSGCHLVGADFTRANLTEAEFIGSDFERAYLGEANLTKASLRLTDLSEADLSGADLSGADLSGARLVETDFTDATLSNCRVYGISVWNVKLQRTKQENLVITPDNESTVTVDNLEVAQFIYLLLNNKKIRDVIDTITSKVVLILGRFTPERKAILDVIRDELRKYNYLPVLFDFDKPASRDTHETVTTLARLARFVIADITDPKSIPQELVSIVETLPSLPIQPLLKFGSEPWGMYDHIKRYPWVLEIHQYRDLDELLTSFGERVIAPAAAKTKELRES
jgi:uncharacterized protein YjbI with pentapeptide repeats